MVAVVVLALGPELGDRGGESARCQTFGVCVYGLILHRYDMCTFCLRGIRCWCAGAHVVVVVSLTDSVLAAAAAAVKNRTPLAVHASITVGSQIIPGAWCLAACKVFIFLRRDLWFVRASAVCGGKILENHSGIVFWRWKRFRYVCRQTALRIRSRVGV